MLQVSERRIEMSTTFEQDPAPDKALVRVSAIQFAESFGNPAEVLLRAGAAVALGGAAGLCFAEGDGRAAVRLPRAYCTLWCPFGSRPAPLRRGYSRRWSTHSASTWARPTPRPPCTPTAAWRWCASATGTRR